MLALTAHSPATRAVVSMLRSVAASGAGGLTTPGLSYVLAKRHAGSTVRGVVRRLAIGGRIAECGRWHGARIWRSV